MRLAAILLACLSAIGASGCSTTGTGGGYGYAGGPVVHHDAYSLDAGRNCYKQQFPQCSNTSAGN